MSYVSPARYAAELLLRRVLAGKTGGDLVLVMLGFTWGTATCIALLVSFTLICLFTGWAVMIYKTKDF